MRGGSAGLLPNHQAGITMDAHAHAIGRALDDPASRAGRDSRGAARCQNDRAAARSGARPRRRADQRKARQLHLDQLCRRPLADRDLDAIVLHRRVQILFDHRLQAMDLVDEQDIALTEGWSGSWPACPLCSMAGAPTGRIVAPSAVAIRCASVVLPSPGPARKGRGPGPPASPRRLDKHLQVVDDL